MSEWPRENDATVAVEAAARKVFEDSIERLRRSLPPEVQETAEFDTWDDLDATMKLQVRESVLAPVWAALSALPDPRKTAWLEGLYCGLRQGYEDDNPYDDEEPGS